MKILKGKYHRTVFKVLLYLSLLILCLFVILEVILIRQFNEDEESNYSQFRESSVATASTNLSLLFNELYNIKSNSAIQTWLSTNPGSDDYYREQINAYKAFIKESCDLDFITYDIAIIPDNENYGIITNKGTETRTWFLNDNKHITKELVQKISATLKAGYGLGIFADDPFDIDGYAIVATRAIYPTGNATILATLPLSRIITPHVTYSTTLIGKNCETISTAQEDTVIAIDSSKALIMDAMKERKSEIRIDGIKGKIFIGNLPFADSALLFMDSKAGHQHAMTLSLMLMLLIACTSITAIIAWYFTRKLYTPVNDIIYKLKDKIEETEMEGSDVDEFAVIDKMGSRLQEVTEELMKLAKEKEELPEYRSYRLLLAGAMEEEEDNASRYALALVDVVDKDTEGYGYSLEELQAIMENFDNMTYISLTPARSVIITRLDDETADDMVNTIRSIIYKLDSNDDLRIAISDAVTGKHNINRAYRQSLRLMDFRNAYPTTQILTTATVSKSLVEKNLYTSSMETALIRNVLAGNDKALDIFDEIQGRNVDTTPEIQSYQLYFMLIGSYLRILQELNVSESEILGHPVDWADMLTQWKDDTDRHKIREILSCTIEWVRQGEKDMDAELVHQMQEYIKKNYKYDLMVIDLAKKFNISANYASSLFKKLSNDNFKNYLNRYRVEQAKIKIQENPQIKIQDLCYEVGFNSATSFIRVFNKYEGQSPKNYASVIAQEHDVSEETENDAPDSEK